MSKERELLKRLLTSGIFESEMYEDWEQYIRELLAQPEPFSPDWANYRQGVADAKREPLSDDEIGILWETNFTTNVPYYVFDEICIVIEKAHGIGVDDD